MKTLEIVLSKLTTSSACVIVKDSESLDAKLNYNNGTVAYIAKGLFDGKEKGYAVVVNCESYHYSDLKKKTESGEIVIATTDEGIVLKTCHFNGITSITEKK